MVQKMYQSSRFNDKKNAFSENKKKFHISAGTCTHGPECVNGRYAPEYNFFITYMAASRFSPGRC